VTQRSALREVVKAGGLALQVEDCLIRAAMLHHGRSGGLVHARNERYHQFIIWRAILPLWSAEIERDESTDLLLRSADGDHHFEMKNWRSIAGDSEISPIQRDIDRLRRRASGYILITSANLPSQTEENFAYLSSRLNGIDPLQRSDFRFVTENEKGTAIDFWIAGWPVAF
jgi:hypothetical protein